MICKNAFQQDECHPLGWPPLEVSSMGYPLPPGGDSLLRQTSLLTDPPCRHIRLQADSPCRQIPLQMDPLADPPWRQTLLE